MESGGRGNGEGDESGVKEERDEREREEGR